MKNNIQITDIGNGKVRIIHNNKVYTLGKCTCKTKHETYENEDYVFEFDECAFCHKLVGNIKLR